MRATTIAALVLIGIVLFIMSGVTEAFTNFPDNPPPTNPGYVACEAKCPSIATLPWSQHNTANYKRTMASQQKCSNTCAAKFV